MRSGGEAALSLRDEAVVDRERERDSLRRLRLASRDLERFLDLSRSFDRDRDRLRFLLCLLLLECLDRDELRLRERPMLTTSTKRDTPNYCVVRAPYLDFSSARSSLKLLSAINDQEGMLHRFCFGRITIQNSLLFCPTSSL